MTQRVRRLRVRGFRGYPDEVVIELDGKGMCLVAENGHGKTTLADAVEFLRDGDLDAFHREGCSLTSAIHLDAASAEVEIVGTRGSVLRRDLTRAGASDLMASGAAADDDVRPRLPVLRHSTMARFMNATAGEKKKALLALIGLDPLNDFREPLRRACGRGKRTADEARRQLDGERATLAAQLGDEQLVPYAERRRRIAGLEQEVRAPRDILSLALDPRSAATPGTSQVVAVEDLARLLGALPPDPSAAWNAEVADVATVRTAAMSEVVTAARKVVGDDTETCPVCEHDVVGAELAARLAARATELADAKKRLASVAADMDGFGDALDRVVARGVEVAEGETRAARDAPAVVLNAVAGLKEHVDNRRAARRELRACDGAPGLDALIEALPALRASAADSSAEAQSRALVELTQLREKCLRVDEAQRRRHAADEAEAAANRILAIADEEIQAAITAAIQRLGVRAADFYGRLVRGAPYSDLRLVYKPARSGQVEFSFTFDGRHPDVCPPQRVMSTSQLNALGLALMLARLHEDGGAWRTIILDDVVNSFDAPHRQGLARLLADEFSDWQIVVLTHDRAFAQILRRIVKEWRFRDVASFSPTTGPIFADSNPRSELRRRLDEGATAMELGHLARRALEQGLKDPLAKLGFPTLHFDPEQRYGAYDYLSALRRGFKLRKSELKDLPVLARMEADSYMINLGVHDRFDPGALATDDLYRLLDDLDAFKDALHCADCGDPIWKEQRGERLHCGCNALAA